MLQSKSTTFDMDHLSSQQLDLPSFQAYQQAFCAHLRSPVSQPKPHKVSAKRMAVYTEIVFNNLFEAVSACFPVAKSVLGKRAWLRLVQSFLREHAAQSPLFRQIPEEFLNFLATQQSLPPYLHSLCHYEWIELRVASMPDQVIETAITQELLQACPVFNHTMHLLHYSYAVHKISAKHKPMQPEQTALLVFRNTDDKVTFIALNPITYKLLEVLQHGQTTSFAALTSLANDMGQTTAESTIQFGLEMLQQLQAQGVILGGRRECANTHQLAGAQN